MPLARPIAAAVLLLAAGTLAAYTHWVPDPAQVQRDHRIQLALTSRSHHIGCGELFDLMHNNQIRVVLLDVRSETDFNLFHLVDARRLPPEDLQAAWLYDLPPESIKVVMSNDVAAAEVAWQALMRRDIPGVYILEGGVNHWLDVYAGHQAAPATGVALALTAAPAPGGNDQFRHPLTAALGGRWPASDPQPGHAPKVPFIAKVKFAKPVTKLTGGCGG